MSHSPDDDEPPLPTSELDAPDQRQTTQRSGDDNEQHQPSDDGRQDDDNDQHGPGDHNPEDDNILPPNPGPSTHTQTLQSVSLPTVSTTQHADAPRTPPPTQDNPANTHTPSSDDNAVMRLNIRDFVSYYIKHSTNPHIIWGWHHGPYTNPNHGYVCPRDPKSKMPYVKVDENRRKLIKGVDGAPDKYNVNHDPLLISKVNGGVCMFRVDPSDDMMCGMAFPDQPTLRRHFRTHHGCGAANPLSSNITMEEHVAGRAALIKFIRDKHWRRATFAYKPGEAAGTFIGKIATDLETLASQNTAFRHQFGRHYHRCVAEMPSSVKKRKTGRNAPLPEETPSKKPRQGNGGSGSGSGAAGGAGIAAC